MSMSSNNVNIDTMEEMKHDLTDAKSIPSINTPVVSLDDDENIDSTKYYYIKYASGEIDELPLSSAKISPIISELISADEPIGLTKETAINLPTINDTILKRMVEYINYFDGKDETNPPEKPIPKIPLEKIFKNELPLFNNMYKESDKFCDRMLSVNEYITAALYFGFKHYYIKICA